MLLTMLTSSGFDLEAAVVSARREVGLKHEALAALMGLSSQHLSHQLSGRAHLSLRRLLLVATDPDGRKFLHALFARIADYIGLEDRGVLAQQLRTFIEQFPKLVDRFQVQMVKAELREREERKRA